MIDVSRLGGGYAESTPDPGPTIQALLAAAHPGGPSARLSVLAGPPGVGKSAVGRALIELCPQTFLLDKDQTASDFILEAAALRSDGPSAAYGSAHYWQKLRPIEYAGPLSTACTNLVANRQILFVGGFILLIAAMGVAGTAMQLKAMDVNEEEMAETYCCCCCCCCCCAGHHDRSLHTTGNHDNILK